jgi:hypothetical protein
MLAQHRLLKIVKGEKNLNVCQKSVNFSSFMLFFELYRSKYFKPFIRFHNWLAPTDHKKSNTDKMLLLSGEYRIRTDDPLTASQML